MLVDKVFLFFFFFARVYVKKHVLYKYKINETLFIWKCLGQQSWGMVLCLPCSFPSPSFLHDFFLQGFIWLEWKPLALQSLVAPSTSGAWFWVGVNSLCKAQCLISDPISLSWSVYLMWSQQIKACVFLFGLSNVWQRLSNEREMSESFYTWRKRYLLFILYISNSNFVYALCCVKAVADYEKHIHTAKSSNLNNCEGIWTACCHQLKGQSFWILSFPPKN